MIGPIRTSTLLGAVMCAMAAAPAPARADASALQCDRLENVWRLLEFSYAYLYRFKNHNPTTGPVYEGLKMQRKLLDPDAEEAPVALIDGAFCSFDTKELPDERLARLSYRCAWLTASSGQTMADWRRTAGVTLDAFGSCLARHDTDLSYTMGLPKLKKAVSQYPKLSAEAIPGQIGPEGAPIAARQTLGWSAPGQAIIVDSYVGSMPDLAGTPDRNIFILGILVPISN